MGRPPATVVVYAWVPLAVFEALQAAHLEVAWLPLLRLALGWRRAGRMIGAGLALGAATLFKLMGGTVMNHRATAGCVHDKALILLT